MNVVVHAYHVFKGRKERTVMIRDDKIRVGGTYEALVEHLCYVMPVPRRDIVISTPRALHT